MNIVFNTYHYLDRWLNDKTYEELLQVSDNDSILVDDHEDRSQDNDRMSIEFESDGELFDHNNLSQHKEHVEHRDLETNNAKVKYYELCNITKELFKCVIDDQEKSKSALNFVA